MKRDKGSQAPKRKTIRAEELGNATHRIRIIVYAEALRFPFGNTILDDRADGQAHAGSDFCTERKGDSESGTRTNPERERTVLVNSRVDMLKILPASA